MTSPKENNLSNQKGQTFVEFIFVLALLITVSFSFMRGFNSYVGNRWEVMLKIIARPNSGEVRLP